MTIEVRQMLIKSTVSAGDASGAAAAGGQAATIDAREIEQWKEDVLAECKAWFEAKLNELHER